MLAKVSCFCKDPHLQISSYHRGSDDGKRYDFFANTTIAQICSSWRYPQTQVYTIFLLRFVGWGGKGGRSSDEILEEILTLKEDQQLFQASMTTRKDQTSDMWEAEGIMDDFTEIDGSDDGDDCNSDDGDDGSNDGDDEDHPQ